MHAFSPCRRMLLTTANAPVTATPPDARAGLGPIRYCVLDDFKRTGQEKPNPEAGIDRRIHAPYHKLPPMDAVANPRWVCKDANGILWRAYIPFSASDWHPVQFRRTTRKLRDGWIDTCAWNPTLQSSGPGGKYFQVVATPLFANRWRRLRSSSAVEARSSSWPVGTLSYMPRHLRRRWQGRPRMHCGKRFDRL